MERVNGMRALGWSVLWENPHYSVPFDLVSAAAASVCFRPLPFLIPPSSWNVVKFFDCHSCLHVGHAHAAPSFGGVRVILRANCLASLAVNSVVYRLTPYRMSIYISIPSVYPTILPSIHPSVYPTARRTPLALLLPICRVMLISDIILTAKQIQLCPTPL